MRSPRYNTQHGYIGVVTVLVISAIALTIGVTAALLGINEMQFSYYTDQSAVVLHQADGCLEEGMYRLKLDPSYTGGSIPYADASCTVTVSGAGGTRTVTSTLTHGDFTKTIQGSVTFSTNTSATTEGIDLTEWSEQ